LFEKSGKRTKINENCVCELALAGGGWVLGKRGASWKNVLAPWGGWVVKSQGPVNCLLEE